MHRVEVIANTFSKQKPGLIGIRMFNPFDPTSLDSRGNMNFESALAAKLHRAGCPDTEQLGAYHLSQIEPADATEIEQHLELCPHCQTELDALKQFMALPRPDLAQAEPSISPEKTGYQRVKRWTAKLIQIGSQMIDDLGKPGQAQPQLAPALRGGGVEIPPHVYAAEDIQIILEAQALPQEKRANDHQMKLSGTILSLDHRFHQVVLESDGLSIPSSPIDEMGYFLFDRLPQGGYRLTIVGETAEIEIPKFELAG